MNPHERSITATAVPPATGWTRRRWIAVILAGTLAIAAVGYLTLRYFTLCGNCGGRPILCDNPCTLPTFGSSDIVAPDLFAASQGNETRLVISPSADARAPAPPPPRAS